ncbi:MAG TPA: hypothetical protein DD417_17455 [Elusimicrobia bacterium]|nr:hypothetical protein [Elusimicrobiota bacterium]
MRMRNVEINPGRLCNNRCVFCMSGLERDRREPWVPAATVRAELRRHHAEGARAVGFIGGEPSVYPGIVESVAFARELGYQRISLCTNGMRLSDRRFLGRLVRAGMTRVTVSVHSHLSGVEDALTGVPGGWAKKLQGVRNLVKIRRSGALRDNVSLNPVLCRPNMRSLPEFVRFFAAEGIDDVRCNFIWPQGRAERDPRIVPRFREAVPWMLKLLLANEREGLVRLSFGGVPYCVLPPAFQKRWPLLKKYFYEEGSDLPTDVTFLRGKGKGPTERFNWVERSKDEYRCRVDGCRTCPFGDVCMGIYRSYAALYGQEEFGRPETA